MWLFRIAAGKRRKRLILWIGVALSICSPGLALWFFLPYSEEGWRCDICGRKKGTLTVLGVTCYEREFDTDLSAWYCRLNLPAHVHRWTFDGANVRRWNGQVTCYDIFLEPINCTMLRRFQEASTKMDRPELDDFVREYSAIGQDRVKRRRFMDRLERISPSSGTPEDGS